MSILFAATHPDRAWALLLYGAMAKQARTPDYRRRDRSAGGLLQECLSPGAAQALARMNLAIDVRNVLPAIRVPTLVLHNRVDPWVEVGNGRYLAEHIPGASYVELPEEGHIPSVATSGPFLDEVERFLHRAWEASAAAEGEPERVLSTVLFTDIVGATERAIELGDRAWREVLERQHESPH